MFVSRESEGKRRQKTVEKGRNKGGSETGGHADLEFTSKKRTYLKEGRSHSMRVFED